MNEKLIPAKGAFFNPGGEKCGLVIVSIADSYTMFGQIVILLLIQLGGLGYMTFSSFVILSRKKTLSDTRTEVANVVFSLPQSFRIDKFLRSVILFTATIETAGAGCLYFYSFAQKLIRKVRTKT